MIAEIFNSDSLPSSWLIHALSAFNPTRPSTIDPSACATETFEYYSIPAYQEDRRPILAKGAEIGSSKLVLDSGTVLFGKLNPRVEKVWRVGNYSSHRKIGSTEWLPLVPLDDVDERFLYFLMWSEHVMPKAKTLVSGSTPSRQRVDPQSFYRIKAPLPPLPEQRKIAAVLGQVQRAIEQQDRLVSLTKELKKALLNQVFTHGLRGEPQKETEIGPMPESWELSKIGSVARIQSGGTPARDVPEYWQSGTIPWVKTGEIDYCLIRETEERITPDGLANSAARLLPAGTLLMAMYGQGVTRGRVAILGIESATNQACASITPYEESQVSSRFLYYLLEYHYEDLRRLGHGANQRNMNAALIRGFPVAFPTSVEQAAVVSALEALDAKSDIHRRKCASLTDLFRTLLNQLMTAQIRVHDVNLEELL